MILEILLSYFLEFEVQSFRYSKKLDNSTTVTDNTVFY